LLTLTFSLIISEKRQPSGFAAYRSAFNDDIQRSALKDTPIETDFSAHPTNPWVNDTDSIGEPIDSQEQFDRFASILKNSLRGTRLKYPFESGGANLYLMLGNAAEGYDLESWNYLLAHLKTWCDNNDARHPDGWILLVMAPPSRAKKSVHDMAKFVQDRGIPVVGLLSGFDRSEPGDEDWPSYLSAAYFGLGMHHETSEPQKPGQRLVHGPKCRAGYVRNIAKKPTRKLAFPDDCIHTRYFEGYTLLQHLAGIFVGGGDSEVKDQLGIYKVCGGGRDAMADVFVRANNTKGTIGSSSRGMPIPHMQYNNRHTGSVIGRPGSGRYIMSK